MRDFIERLRAHPEHIRHRIALGTTIGFTSVVGVVWFGTLLTSGSLALDLSTPGSQSTSNGNIHVAANEAQSNITQLLGAVGALQATSSVPTLAPVGVPQNASAQTSSSQDTAGNQNGTSATRISF